MKHCSDPGLDPRFIASVAIISTIIIITVDTRVHPCKKKHAHAHAPRDHPSAHFRDCSSKTDVSYTVTAATHFWSKTEYPHINFSPLDETVDLSHYRGPLTLSGRAYDAGKVDKRQVRQTGGLHLVFFCCRLDMIQVNSETRKRHVRAISHTKSKALCKRFWQYHPWNGSNSDELKHWGVSSVTRHFFSVFSDFWKKQIAEKTFDAVLNWSMCKTWLRNLLLHSSKKFCSEKILCLEIWKDLLTIFPSLSGQSW